MASRTIPSALTSRFRCSDCLRTIVPKQLWRIENSLGAQEDLGPVFLGHLSNVLAITAKTLHNRDERRYLRALICDPI